MSALAAFLAGGFVSAALVSLAGWAVARACTKERASVDGEVGRLREECERLRGEVAIARHAASEWQLKYASKETLCEQLNRELSWRAGRAGSPQC